MKLAYILTHNGLLQKLFKFLKIMRFLYLKTIATTTIKSKVLKKTTSTKCCEVVEQLEVVAGGTVTWYNV